MNTEGSTHKARLQYPLLAIVLIIVMVYLVSRLVWLENLPVFIDEALQISAASLVRRGSIGAGAADGKWLSLFIMSLLTYLPGDPLVQIRLASVISGLFTVVAIIYSGRILFGLGEGLLAALLYVLFPFALFYNRLALSDGIATLFAAWILYISIAAVKTTRGWVSLLLTLLLMAAILAKVSSVVFILIPLLAVFILLPRNRWKSGLRKIFPAIAAALILILAINWVDAGVSQVGSKTFAGDLPAWGLAIQQNLILLTGWFWRLLTPPWALLSFIVFFWAIFIKPGRPGWFLLVIFAISILPYVFLAGDWYPRYLTFALVPLSLLIACFGFWAFATIKSNTRFRRPAIVLSGLLLAVLVLSTIVLDVNMIFRPERADLPDIVRRQYINDWPAGYGAQELAGVIVNSTTSSRIKPILLRPGFLSQTYRGGLELYLDDSDRVRLDEAGWDFQPLFSKIAGQLDQGGQVFFALDTTHQESAALFESLSERMTATRIWYQHKPHVTAGMELWEIHDLLKTPG